MKRDLIYLTLLSALFAAAKVMAQNEGTTSRQELTPRTIEVGFTKTLHILFPAPVTYIDIGSMAIIAGKADGAENVVRVKAAVRDFAEETNLTVITEDGGFYTFDARYAENPFPSTIEIAAAESPTTQPASASEPARTDEGRVLLREVGRERPATVKRVLSDIYRQNRADVKGIHTRKYGVEVEVRGYLRPQRRDLPPCADCQQHEHLLRGGLSPLCRRGPQGGQTHGSTTAHHRTAAGLQRPLDRARDTSANASFSPSRN